MSSDDVARRRLIMMHALRLSGVALVIIGLMGIAGRMAIPREGAYVLLGVGLIDTLVMPTVLARRWKSPRS